MRRHRHLEALVVDHHLALEAGFRHEHGEHAEDLRSLATNTGTPKACCALRHRHTRACHLPSEDAERAAVLVFQPDLAHHLRRTTLITVWIEVVCAKSLKTCINEVIHLQALQDLPRAAKNGLERPPSLVCGIVAHDEHQRDGNQVVRDGRADLVRVRRRLAAAARDAHHVLADLLDPDGGEVARHVGHVVRAGVLDLVAQLLGNAPEAHDAVGARWLRERERPVRIRLHDGVAHVVPLLVLIVREEAAGALRGALDEVPGACAHAELVILVGPPAELMHEYAERECAVDDSPGHDNVAPLCKRCRNGDGAKVSVGTGELNVRHRLARVHLPPAGLAQLGHPVREVVPEDCTDLHRNLGLLADCLQGVSAANRIHAASVDNDFDTFLLERLDVRADHVHNCPCEAQPFVLLPLPREDCHG
mmetsp:Transcript_949/g.2851  ORF Transcript_949/g.2851 Transcript_949/m.2851 type:complete len:420 (+) Transcript_949:740-1999(+)